EGADALELDIRLTADGVPVLLHDPNTSRVADRGLWVHQSTLAQLSELDLGSWHPVHSTPETLMTLRSFLVMAEAYPEVRLFLETKHPVLGRDRAAQALLDAHHHFGMSRQAPGARRRAGRAGAARRATVLRDGAAGTGRDLTRRHDELLGPRRAPVPQDRARDPRGAAARAPERAQVVARRRVRGAAHGAEYRGAARAAVARRVLAVPGDGHLLLDGRRPGGSGPLPRPRRRLGGHQRARPGVAGARRRCTVSWGPWEDGIAIMSPSPAANARPRSPRVRPSGRN